MVFRGKGKAMIAGSDLSEFCQDYLAAEASSWCSWVNVNTDRSEVIAEKEKLNDKPL